MLKQDKLAFAFLKPSLTFWGSLWVTTKMLLLIVLYSKDRHTPHKQSILMRSVTYAQYHLCWVSHTRPSCWVSSMLSVTHKPFTLSLDMLRDVLPFFPVKIWPTLVPGWEGGWGRNDWSLPDPQRSPALHRRPGWHRPGPNVKKLFTAVNYGLS